MESLRRIEPTDEQRQLFAQPHPMNRIIRGAAGSGKTTIALLMLRMAITYHKGLRRRNLEENRPVKAVVFTFNTTLSSYIRQLAESMGDGIEIEVQTLAKYCRNIYPDINNLTLVNNIEDSKFTIEDDLGIGLEYLYSEVDYIMGRFQEHNLTDYLDAIRVGKGTKPRIDRALRARILEEVVFPYQAYKKQNMIVDWNDINQWPINNDDTKFDIIVADETQDFSANELRTIVSMLHEQSHGTFVIDTVQKIYNRGFTWREIGLDIRAQNSFRLRTNYRNSYEIARFAYQFLQQVMTDDDGTVPNYSSCKLSGSLPKVISGTFNQQVDFVIEYLKNNVDLTSETVCFMNKSTNTQRHLKTRLQQSNIVFANLTRTSNWPALDTNVVLSTMHSAKGLEFDHVILLGLSNEFLRYDEDVESDSYLNICRLLTVSITRAKRSVILGYKEEDKPSILNLIDQDTYEKMELSCQ
ncbi:TPA: 3'-5' exonuclease [Photobacterium damselae]